MINDTAILVHSDWYSIRWSDMDAYGHINNTLYMRYMEESRIRLLESWGFMLAPGGISPVVVTTSATFYKSASYPDELQIKCYIDEAGHSSFMTYYKIFSSKQPETPICEGSAKIVWIDHTIEKSVPLPQFVRSKFIREDPINIDS